MATYNLPYPAERGTALLMKLLSCTSAMNEDDNPRTRSPYPTQPRQNVASTKRQWSQHRLLQTPFKTGTGSVRTLYSMTCIPITLSRKCLILLLVVVPLQPNSPCHISHLNLARVSSLNWCLMNWESDFLEGKGPSFSSRWWWRSLKTAGPGSWIDRWDCEMWRKTFSRVGVVLSWVRKW